MAKPRGPAPTPSAVNARRGNPGKRAVNHDEPRPKLVAKVPTPPKTLGDVAKAEWKRLASELIKLKLLSVLDMTMLEIYCENYEQYRQADEELKAHFKRTGEYTVKHTNKAGHENDIPHPALRIRREALEMMRSIGGEFGFTPSSRSRLKVAPSETPGADLAKYLKKRQAQREKPKT